MTIEIWEENGIWEWDVRWPGPPKMRSTGCSSSLPAALTAVTEEVLAFS